QENVIGVDDQSSWDNDGDGDGGGGGGDASAISANNSDNDAANATPASYTPLPPLPSSRPLGDLITEEGDQMSTAKGEFGTISVKSSTRMVGTNTRRRKAGRPPSKENDIY
ncbi:hypothetical protein EV182_007687, partial [Spiromyces aspiralis]